MLFLTVAALTIAGGALAGPTKRSSGLSVSLSGPISVDSVDELKITAKVSNTGNEDIKVLKYGSVLDDILPTRSFKVSKDGAEAKFVGIKAQVQLDIVDDSVYATIPAGQSVEVSHEIGSLYEFAALGTGTFTFEPTTTFQVAGANEAVADISALSKVSAEGSKAIEIEIKSDVAKRELLGVSEAEVVKRDSEHVQRIDKRAVVSCSTSSQASFISSSYSEGKSLASLASSYISSNGANSLYAAYWGSYSTSTIRSKFSAVASESSSSRTLSCSDPYGACTSGVIAYTLISSTNIYYCSPFYSEVTTSRLCSGTSVASRNIRGGTTLHELTHAVAGTDDITYGCSADQALSDSQSAINADSYNCFATQVYANTQC